MTSTARWAAQVIAAGRARGTVPGYGSPEWAALPPADPRRIAAVVIAAECWRAESDPTWRAAQRAAEVDGYSRDLDTQVKTVLDATCKQIRRPRPVTTANRAAWAAPRPDDYLGGPVAWNTDTSLSGAA